MSSFLQSMDKFNSLRVRDLKAMIKQMILPRYEHRKLSSFQIVDIGSLTGLSSTILAKKLPGAQVLGVDPDEKMVDFAETNHSGDATFVHADIGQRDFLERLQRKLGPTVQLPFADLVVSAHMLHVTDPNLDTVLENIKAILKPNGSMYVTFSFWTELLQMGREIAESILAQSSTDIPKMNNDSSANPVGTRPNWRKEIPELRIALRRHQFAPAPEMVYVTNKIRLNTLRQFQDCIRFIYPMGPSLPESKKLSFFSKLFDQIYNEYMERENMKGFTYEYLFVCALRMATETPAPPPVPGPLPVQVDQQPTTTTTNRPTIVQFP